MDILWLQIPVGKDFRLSGKAVKRAITSNTILVVASSPGFPHGVVDHVQDIAQVSGKHWRHGGHHEAGWLRSNCCIFYNPFAEELCSVSYIVRAVLRSGLCYWQGAYPLATRWAAA